MQLKIQRSQRAGGVTGGKVFFCLDVRADYSSEEQSNIRKYGLGSQHLYNSRAAQQHLDSANTHLNRTQSGDVKNRAAGLARGVLSLAMSKMTLHIRASLAANTSIKLAGGTSTSDARALASDMRTTADFILSQPRLHFACHIRNVTPSAVSIPVPVGELESEPRLTDEAYERLRDLNRLRVSLPQTARGDGFTFRKTHGSDTAADPPRRQHEFREGTNSLFGVAVSSFSTSKPSRV